MTLIIFVRLIILIKLNVVFHIHFNVKKIDFANYIIYTRMDILEFDDGVQCAIGIFCFGMRDRRMRKSFISQRPNVFNRYRCFLVWHIKNACSVFPSSINLSQVGGNDNRMSLKCRRL